MGGEDVNISAVVDSYCESQDMGQQVGQIGQSFAMRSSTRRLLQALS